MDWPFWLVSPKLLHYKRGNSGKGKERKPILLSGAGAIIACTSSLKLGWILIEEKLGIG
jgi:hypothetical protein